MQQRNCRVMPALHVMQLESATELNRHLRHRKFEAEQQLMQVERRISECQAAYMQLQAHNSYMQHVLDTMTPVSFTVLLPGTCSTSALFDTAIPKIHHVHNVIGMLAANNGPHEGSH